MNACLHAKWELSSKKEKKNPETGEKRDGCKKWASELWPGASTLRADVALPRAGI